MTGVRTIMRGGSRWYIDPDDPERRYPGVTSVLGMLAKPFLVHWAARITAETAVQQLPALQSMTATGDTSGAVDYLKAAHRRYTRARAEVGSMAHDVFERLMRGEHVGHVHPDIARHVQHFRDFLRWVNPELVRAEEVAWSDRHQYAGSFDAILRVWLDENQRPTPDRSGEPALIMVDYKTSRDTYPDVALQLAAYAYAETLMDAEGNREPMPELDGAAVLHVTEERWAFKPVRVDDDVFAAFRALRTVFEWERATSRGVVGRPLSAGGLMVTGTQRRSR